MVSGLRSQGNEVNAGGEKAIDRRASSVVRRPSNLAADGVVDADLAGESGGEGALDVV